MKNITNWNKLTIKQRFQKDVYFGKGRFKKLKETCYSLLDTASQNWDEQCVLVTEEDYEQRKLRTSIAQLGTTLLAGIRKGERFRSEMRFRKCTYTFGPYKGRFVYILNFYKVSEKRFKNNYLKVDQYPFSETTCRFSRAQRNIKLESILEKGKFRYEQVFFDEMNFHLYPTDAEKYSIKMHLTKYKGGSLYRYLRN